MRGHVIKALSLMRNHEVKDSDTKLPTDQEQGKRPTLVKEGNRRLLRTSHPAIMVQRKVLSTDTLSLQDSTMIGLALSM